MRARSFGGPGAPGAGLAALSLALLPRAAGAHGIGQRYDLPVPLWLWATAGAAAVVLSFLVMAVAVRDRPGRQAGWRLDLLRAWPGRLLASSPVLLTARLLTLAAVLLVLAACFAGDQTPTRNLAPTAIWVGWWVGLAYVSALAGNVWGVVNPWSSVSRWAGGRAPSGSGARRRRYPAWLGTWPAVVLFWAFAWVELVFTGRTSPFQLGLLLVGYSIITFAGMAWAGRAAWLDHADPFAVAFGVLSRFAPTEVTVSDPAVCRRCGAACARPDGCRDCGECFEQAGPGRRALSLRPYGAGLQDTAGVSTSVMVFVLLLLSTVTFDGFTATPAWAALDGWLYAALAPLGDARLTVIGTLGLLAFPLIFVAVYLLFARGMAAMGGPALSTMAVARLFVLSLVPIAIAYHLAHYFTYLLIQGQLLIRLASDPLGLGWNLLGTARYRPDIGLVGARAVWYTAVAAIVLGHVIAVYVAHVVALREYPDRRAALRSQVPMLLLMVGYTVVSLWIIAQPIVESR
jgi:hypothetical protein